MIPAWLFHGSQPAWANGAKVLVPGIGSGDVAEARVHLKPRHVVVFAGNDVAEVLDALTFLPSRGRPRLKPSDAIAPVPAAGDISLFADASGSGGSSSIGCTRDLASSELKSVSSSTAADWTLDARGMPLSQLPIGIAFADALRASANTLAITAHHDHIECGAFRLSCTCDEARHALGEASALAGARSRVEQAG